MRIIFALYVCNDMILYPNHLGAALLLDFPLAEMAAVAAASVFCP